MNTEDEYKQWVSNDLIHVDVCPYGDQPLVQYTQWLLGTIGFSGPDNWLWIDTFRYGGKARVNWHAIGFRRKEDAVAFKLKFGL